MCFSAGASFSAGVVLSIIGAASIYSSKTTPQRVFACIPVIFSVQQFIEGILWLALANPVYVHWETGATYTFLVIACIVWPILIPFSVLLLENNFRRKKILFSLLGFGVLFGIYFGYCLKVYGASAIIEQHHIRYVLHFAFADKWYFGLLYFIPTVLPPSISSIKGIRWLAFIFLVSYTLSRIFYHYYVISVWCFFATIISLVVLSVILKLRDPKDEKSVLLEK
ncbi:MAG TPA: DUF6629 family protein [Flavipsychrobacter sp.]|nr:DUF6629 family protein [Flavipsychrobacter sp.]